MEEKKKPIIVDADQWFKNGDHPKDECRVKHQKFEAPRLSEGRVVRYYRNPDDDGSRECDNCGKMMYVHGWIDTSEEGYIVCPGDWIITGVKGEYYPCKPDIFEETYEEVSTLREKGE